MEGNKYLLTPARGAQDPTATVAGSGVSLDKQQQKAVKTRVLDHVGPYLRHTQARLSASSVRHAWHLQAVFACSLDMLPPLAYPHMPASSIGTKFVTSSFFRHRAAINHLAYTPDGRRLLCAGNNGNVSLWNGTNFENELGPGIQVHEASPIRCMIFSHSGLFLLSCDDMGRVKFSKPTLEVLQVYHAHKEPCRSVSFSPTDFKFTTGSDDSTVRVFDTFRGQELSMTGHGGDVRWVDWHPTKGVIASCSKDACIKLWDPRVGTCLSTLHGHKNGIFQAKWNLNGYWLLSCSRDQLVKLYDIRMLREMSTFAGHGRDVTCVAWHPQHEELFVSGATDGSLMMWLVSRPDAQGVIPAAHDASVWTTAWHPLGHVLASAGADQKCQFWCRKRPGDIWRDVYGHDPMSTGGIDSACGATPTGVDSALSRLGGGLLGSSAGIGVSSVPTAGLGTSSGLGTTIAPSRPNIIPGIGAVMDQLSTASLQVFMAAVAPPGRAAASAPPAGSGGGCAALAGPGRALGTKRIWEDSSQGSVRFGVRDREGERDANGEVWLERGRERGPSKIMRMNLSGARGGAGTGGMGGPDSGAPPGGIFPRPGGADRGSEPAYGLQRVATGPTSHVLTSYDAGYDPGSGRPGPTEMGEKLGLGVLLHARPPPHGERRHGDMPSLQYVGPEASERPLYDRYVHQPHMYVHGGRPLPSMDQLGKPYGGYQPSYGDPGSLYREGGGAHGGSDGYRKSGPERPFGAGQGRGPGRGPTPHHRGDSSSMFGHGRGRGRGWSSGW